MDGLIIISEDFLTRLKRIEFVLKRLMEAVREVNRDKCESACSSVTYLGYLLDKDRLRPNPERVKPVLDMPNPKNIAELGRTLGMFSWYSRFIANEADMKIPLVRLLRKENP